MKQVILFISMWLFFLGNACSIQDYAVAKFILSKQKEQPNSKSDEQEPNVNGVVEVSFKIDSEGKVQVVKMNATSQELAEYVLQKLNKIQLKEVSAELGKIIHYRFVFKKQA